MKIVQIEDVFHPEAGYLENVLSKYFIIAGHETTIISSELDKINTPFTNFFGKDNLSEKDGLYEKKYRVKIKRIPLHTYYSGRAIYRFNLLKKTIFSEKPDLVYFHENTSLACIWFLKHYNSFKIPVLLESHMLEMASKNKFNKLFSEWYAKRITPIIVKNRIPVIRIQDDNYVEKRLGIPIKQCPFISVGTDTTLFKPDDKVKKEMRKKYDISVDSIVVIYAGKLDESKGARLLADSIKQRMETNEDVVFMIVGNTSGEFGSEIDDILSTSENRIIRVPTQKYENLAAYYKMADVAVFPKQCSLSFYDVQASGLPVLFEDNPVNRTRMTHHSACLFKPDDIIDFRAKLSAMIDMSLEKRREMSDAALSFIHAGYDYKDICDDYLKIIYKTINSQRKRFSTKK